MEKDAEPTKVTETIPLASGLSVQTNAEPVFRTDSDKMFSTEDAKLLEEAGKKGLFEQKTDECSE